MNKDEKEKLKLKLDLAAHPLDTVYKEIISLKSQLHSMHIYCQEMEQFTKDLEGKFDKFRELLQIELKNE